MADDKKTELDPNALLGGGNGDDEEEGEDEITDPEEFLAAAMSEILETGLPVRFVVHAADPFALPLIRRIHRQNEILADISATLRAVARKMGCEFQPDKTLHTADLKK
jgi:hypothetical protein